MKYFDLENDWDRVRPFICNKKVQKTLIRDMNILFNSRWKKEYEPDKVPYDYECDFDFKWNRKGRKPAYWQYTKYGACHWLVNFNLELAKLVLPKKPWSIIKSKKHSTVWDRGELLFEFNLLAFGASPDECFEAAMTNGRILKPGRQRKCNKLEFWLEELERERAECKAEGRIFIPHG